MSHAIHYRSLTPMDDHSPHFLAALQVLAHVISPLRKALIHFYLLSRNKHDLEKVEWRALRAIGHILKELIAKPAADGETTSQENDDDDDEDSEDDDEESSPPVEPTELYKELEPCLEKFKKSLKPKDATEALQILLETLRHCARALPLTSHLWVDMMDQAGLGLMTKAVIGGKCPLIEDGQILQRTLKETVLEWCPLVVPKTDSLEESVKAYCARKPFDYDFDKKPYQFEVKIPLLSPEQAGGLDTSNWTTTRSLLFTSLTSYLFIGVDRVSKETGKFDESEVVIPQKLDLSKLCEKGVKGSKEYELVGGVLRDEEDYIAIVKNSTITDPEDEDAWKLMESEEVIPMTESDALDFLKGEGEGAPCGTVLAYRRCDEQKQMKQLLSDIIISQVSGALDADTDFYYEEEVIEE